MRTQAFTANLPDMTELSHQRRFELLVATEAEPIEGVLADEAGRWPFSGWSGLAVALERALSAAGSDRSRGRA